MRAFHLVSTRRTSPQRCCNDFVLSLARPTSQPWVSPKALAIASRHATHLQQFHFQVQDGRASLKTKCPHKVMQTSGCAWNISPHLRSHRDATGHPASKLIEQATHTASKAHKPSPKDKAFACTKPAIVGKPTSEARTRTLAWQASTTTAPRYTRTASAMPDAAALHTQGSLCRMKATCPVPPSTGLQRSW
jgi:hypothetical protein